MCENEKTEKFRVVEISRIEIIENFRDEDMSKNEKTENFIGIDKPKMKILKI